MENQKKSTSGKKRSAPHFNIKFNKSSSKGKNNSNNNNDKNENVKNNNININKLNKNTNISQKNNSKMNNNIINSNNIQISSMNNLNNNINNYNNSNSILGKNNIKISKPNFNNIFSKNKLNPMIINSNSQSYKKLKVQNPSGISNSQAYKYKLNYNKPNILNSSWNFNQSSDVYDLQEASWDVTKKNRPSDRLRKIKFSDPFAVGIKHQTNFGYVYSAGGIPVRIEHGNVNLKLKWDIEPENLDYDPTLIICFEGLLETKHPYNFAGKQCVREMLMAKGAAEKIIPILSRLILPLKNALACNKPEVFLEAMDITEQLSILVKEQLNPFLHFFLQMINKRSFNIKYKEKVFDLLRVLEMNGGEEALNIIKQKIPTYMSAM